MMAWVLDQALILLHPVMPFITEALWTRTATQAAPRDGLLINAAWPDASPSLIDVAADAEIGLVIAAVSEGRSVRAELNVPPSARPELLVTEASPAQRDVFERNAAVIGQTLRVSGIRFETSLPSGAIPFMVEGASLALPVAAFIDLPVERARLIKEIAGHEAAIQRAEAKLGNADFMARAPEAVVEENRERQEEASAAKQKLGIALARLEGMASLHGSSSGG